MVTHPRSNRGRRALASENAPYRASPGHSYKSCVSRKHLNTLIIFRPKSTYHFTYLELALFAEYHNVALLPCCEREGRLLAFLTLPASVDFRIPDDYAVRQTRVEVECDIASVGVEKVDCKTAIYPQRTRQQWSMNTTRLVCRTCRLDIQNAHIHIK